MNAIHPVRPTDNSNRALPAFAVGQFRQMISAIEANQIEALAKKMIVPVMSRLHIGVDHSFQPVEGHHYKAIDGELHPLMDIRYDRDCKFMQALLPILEEQIAQSFSNPALFLESGIVFHADAAIDTILRNSPDVFADEEKTDSGEVRSMVNMMKSWGINTLAWQITLKLDQRRTWGHIELYFERQELLNGDRIGASIFTINACEQSALHATVHL